MTSIPDDEALANGGEGASGESDAEVRTAAVRAAREGRINGKYRCPRCGMRSHDQEEAATCCPELGPPSSERVSDSRYYRTK